MATPSSPPATRHTATATLPLSMRPITPSSARAWIHATLHRWGLDELVDTVELLASELIGNAIRHTGRPRHLRLRHGAASDGTTLTCEVTDDDPRPPRTARASSPDDESGRGMGLVALLTERNGTTPTRDGKAVWFQLLAAAPAR
ncbi:ATP-binding protein [Streptomyces sp. NPDC055092]